MPQKNEVLFLLAARIAYETQSYYAIDLNMFGSCMCGVFFRVQIVMNKRKYLLLH